MSTNLSADLRRLETLAYHRAEWSGAWMRQFHRLPKRAKQHPDFPLIEKIRRWLLAPLTLWPVNLAAVGDAALARVRQGKRQDPATLLLLEMLPEAPGESTQAAVARHEHEVEKGSYEHLIQASHKFDHKEQELAHSPELQAEWRQIRTIFPVSRYQDRKGIIRRHFVQERNFRPAWNLDWKKETDRFNAVFDTFCHRWNLYGMRGNQPMLLKTTVNLTPFGTLIFIPAYWNFDPKRDLKWRAITMLHRARGVPRQGPKLGMNQAARRDEALRARDLIAQAKARGIKGSEREYWVMGQLGWDSRTDPSRLRRLVRSIPKTASSHS